MRLMLAGWLVELRVDPPCLAEAVARRYKTFAGTIQQPADLTLTISNQAGESAAWEPAVNNLSLLQASLSPKGEDYLLDAHPFYGIIAALRGQAALRMRSPNPTREIEYFLRVALALFALRHDGLLLHCAALKRAGLTVLFIGQSGSGKSTVVNLSRAAGRATALGDDLILLRREGARWRAYGTPFWNLQTADRSGQAETGVITGIYKLVQDQGVFVEPMGVPSATAELVANCPVVNDQAALLPLLIERCSQLAAAVGVQRLHFRKDDSFWDII